MSEKSTDYILSMTHASKDEIEAYRELVEHLDNCPIPKREILGHLGLFLTRSSLSRIMFMHELYRKVLNTHGVVIEFGVRWGQNMALFTTFRNMYEPYNYRKIIGFDTFEGFPSVSSRDGKATSVVVGGLSVAQKYEDTLSRILDAQERLAPRSHIRKHQLIKGDVLETLPKYLRDHPETIIALAYFDLDLYEPTKKCLELILPHLTKNSIIGFDELNYEPYPGETIALKEIISLQVCKLHRNPSSGNQCYLTFE